MGVGNVFRSSLYSIHGIVQNAMIVHPKETIIAVMRDFFSDDPYYHYVKDPWGFALTPDHTDLPLTAGYLENGVLDTTTTRLFIGENYRYDVIFYPAILVKHGGTKSVPVSINRDTAKVKWGERLFVDGYGHSYIMRNAEHLIFSGAWEGSIIVEVRSRSLRARDDLVELIGIYFTQIGFEMLRKSGVIVKPISVGAPTEILDRNDELFLQSLTLDVRTEWQVNVPIANIVEVISFIMEFGQTGGAVPPDPNFSIITQDRVSDVVDLIMSGQPLPYFSPIYQPFQPPE
jgi:hypothetical protein